MLPTKRRFLRGATASAWAAGDPPCTTAASATVPIRASAARHQRSQVKVDSSLRTKAEAAASTDFTPQWAGQAARLGRERPAAELTRRLAAEALALASARRVKTWWQKVRRFL